MEAKMFNNPNIARGKLVLKKARNPLLTIDRLSVRTEVSHSAQNPLHPPPITRKPITLPSEETLPTNERLLYFSPNESDASRTLSSLVSMTTGGGTCEADEPELAGSKMEASPGVKAGTAAALHDTILATQLRHINRELTPTISEVYHERNIGLGLAPPLSKLLLNQSGGSAPKTDSTVLEKITLGILDDEDISNELSSSKCQRCNLDNCNCQKSTKPWMTENASALQQIQSSDLTTADILEREVKNKLVLRSEQRQKDELEPKRLSPFSEMSRRDEGDGRSIADSTSSSYKNTQFLTYHNVGDKNKIKPSAKIRTIPKQRRNPQN